MSATPSRKFGLKKPDYRQIDGTEQLGFAIGRRFLTENAARSKKVTANYVCITRRNQVDRKSANSNIEHESQRRRLSPRLDSVKCNRGKRGRQAFSGNFWPMFPEGK
jgi:hypothetical protein